MPARFEVPKGDVIMSAVIVDIDPTSGRSTSIERLQRIIKMDTKET